MSGQPANLYKQEETPLRRFFMRRFRNENDVADATQETFLRMLSASRGTLIENPQAYLYRVAQSVAISFSKRTALEQKLFCGLDLHDLPVADEAPCQERIVDGRQMLEIFAQAIAKLPNRCQQVFILSRLHDMPNGEIARELGISRNMVEKHIIKALLHCRTLRAEMTGRL